MTTQNARLLEYLKTHKRGITTGEAYTQLGIMRLSERCRELEGKTYAAENAEFYGHPLKTYKIDRTRERIKGRFGTATVVRYRLA